MKTFSAVLVVLATTLVANAAVAHDSLSIASRHARLAQRGTSLTTPLVKRCKQRSKPSKAAAAANDLKAAAPEEDKPKAPKPDPKPDTPKSDNNNNGNSGGQGAAGTIKVSSNSCGPTGATKKTTKTSGPNGSIDWLNCGINDGGWRPPYVRVEDVVVMSLGEALSNGNSPFHACSKFAHLFEQYGGQFGVPAIMLASFAMQESSCNPNTVGGGGEQGLMQITKEKCGGAPGGDCRNIDFNIRTGAKFFADTLNRNNGDLLISLGQYNGWFSGLTVGKATAAANSACCRCQNNLDYLHQFLNGWCQNINAYDNNLRLGTYFNLDRCN